MLHDLFRNAGTFILDLFAPLHKYLAQEHRREYMGVFRDRESGLPVTNVMSVPSAVPKAVLNARLKPPSTTALSVTVAFTV